MYLEAPPGIEPGSAGLQPAALATWPWSRKIVQGPVFATFGEARYGGTGQDPLSLPSDSFIWFPPSVPKNFTPAVSLPLPWAARRRIVVRTVGFEPTWISPLPPRGSAYASSATFAFTVC